MTFKLTKTALAEAIKKGVEPLKYKASLRRHCPNQVSGLLSAMTPVKAPRAVYKDKHTFRKTVIFNFKRLMKKRGPAYLVLSLFHQEHSPGSTYKIELSEVFFRRLK